LSSHIAHSVFLNILTLNQRRCLNSPLINMDNKKNEFAPSFNSFNHKFSPGNHLIDSFSNKISFHLREKNVKNHIQILNNLTLRMSSNSSTSLVISDASIKNNVATSISHIYIHNKPVIRMLHHAMNVISTEAELFAIWCSINQSVGHSNIKKIIIITDSLHTAKKIFGFLCIHIKFTPLPFLRNWENFLWYTTITVSNSGIAQVISSGLYMHKLTMRWEIQPQLPSFPINCHGTSAANTILILSIHSGKCFFKHRTLEKGIS